MVTDRPQVVLAMAGVYGIGLRLLLEESGFDVFTVEADEDPFAAVASAYADVLIVDTRHVGWRRLAASVGPLNITRVECSHDTVTMRVTPVNGLPYEALLGQRELLDALTTPNTEEGVQAHAHVSGSWRLCRGDRRRTPVTVSRSDRRGGLCWLHRTRTMGRGHPSRRS